MGPESRNALKGERNAQGKRKECSLDSGKGPGKSSDGKLRLPNQHPISRHEGLILKELLSLKKRELTLCRELHKSMYTVSDTNHHTASLASKPNMGEQIPAKVQSSSIQKHALQAAMPHKLSKTAIKRLFCDVSTYFSPTSAERTHFIPAGLLKPGQNPRNNQNVTTEAASKTRGRVQFPSTVWKSPPEHNQSLTLDDRSLSHCTTPVGFASNPFDFAAGRSAKSSNCRAKPPEHRGLQIAYQTGTSAFDLERSLHRPKYSVGSYGAATNGVRASTAIDLQSKLQRANPTTPVSVKAHLKTLAVSATVPQKHTLPSFLTKKKRAAGGPRVKIDLGLERSCLEHSVSTYALFSRKSPLKPGGCSSSATERPDLEGLHSKYPKKASGPGTASIWGQVRTEQSHEELAEVQTLDCAQTTVSHQLHADSVDTVCLKPCLPEFRPQQVRSYLQPWTECGGESRSGLRRKLSEVRSGVLGGVGDTSGVCVSGAN